MVLEHYEARLRSNNHIVHVLNMGETTSVSLEGLWWDVDTGNFYLGSEMYGIRKREECVAGR